MSDINITESTVALIDSLKSTTAEFGLAGTGSEYKIVIEIFLYKFFNDKFGYEAKKDKVYGERLRRAKNGMPNMTHLQTRRWKTCSAIFHLRCQD